MREKAERDERKTKKLAASEEPVAAVGGTPSLRTIRNSASSWMERGRAAQAEELAGHQAKLATLEAELEDKGNSMSNAKKSQVSNASQ
jgi:Skp family chaperone for outer membrane proteins